jgi:hypothetical protein
LKALPKARQTKNSFSAEKISASTVLARLLAALAELEKLLAAFAKSA